MRLYYFALAGSTALLTQTANSSRVRGTMMAEDNHPVSVRSHASDYNDVPINRRLEVPGNTTNEERMPTPALLATPLGVRQRIPPNNVLAVVKAKTKKKETLSYLSKVVKARQRAHGPRSSATRRDETAHLNRLQMAKEEGIGHPSLVVYSQKRLDNIYHKAINVKDDPEHVIALKIALRKKDNPQFDAFLWAINKRDSAWRDDVSEVALIKDKVVAEAELFNLFQKFVQMTQTEAVISTAAKRKVWLDEGILPSDVAKRLGIKEGGDQLLNPFISPNFKALEKYIKSYNNIQDRRSVTLEETLVEAYGGMEKFAPILVALKHYPKTNQEASGMQLKLLEKWSTADVTTDVAAARLGMKARGKEAFEYQYADTLLEYVLMLAKKDEATQVQVVNGLVKHFGDSAAAVFITPLQKMDEGIYKKLIGEMFKRWKGRDIEPENLMTKIFADVDSLHAGVAESLSAQYRHFYRTARNEIDYAALWSPH